MIIAGRLIERVMVLVGGGYMVVVKEVVVVAGTFGVKRVNGEGMNGQRERSLGEFSET